MTTSIHTVEQRELPKILALEGKSGNVAFLKGSPSSAKSSIVKQYAKEHNLEVIDLRLAQLESVDLGGLPVSNGDSFTHVPLDIFPLDSKKWDEYLERNKIKGWVLFLDELLLAPPSVQNAAYKIILDKQIGQFDLHKKVQIIAASNLTTDRASVVRENTALATRMVHYRVAPINIDNWIPWAVKNGIDFRVYGFLSKSPEFLDKFDPDSLEDTCPLPRTWEFVSKQIKGIKKLEPLNYKMIAGAIGSAAAIHFNSFCEFQVKLVSYADILKNPKKAKVPTEVGEIFLTVSMIISLAKKKHTKHILTYISNFPMEYQVLLIKSLIAKRPEIVVSKQIRKWRDENKESIL